jgi:hypothetical protein
MPTFETYSVPAEDRTSFLLVLAALVRSDSVVAVIERAAIERTMSVWGTSADAAERVRSVMDGAVPALPLDLTTFQHQRTRLLLIQELVVLAHLDGRYGSEERAFVGDACRHFGVSDGRREQIEDWVLEGVLWMRRGEDLLSPEVGDGTI